MPEPKVTEEELRKEIKRLRQTIVRRDKEIRQLVADSDRHRREAEMAKRRASKAEHKLRRILTHPEGERHD